MQKSLSTMAREHGIHYFLLSFTDLLGTQRAKLVPAVAIDQIVAHGARFAGCGTGLDMTPADPDILARPDTRSVFQLPWRPEIAWVPAQLRAPTGETLPQDPRGVLQRVLRQAAALGYHVKTGVECEYFLLSSDGNALSDDRDCNPKPCYEQRALMRRVDVITEICNAMLKLGWEPYQNDHEGANGQFEMNWAYADALVTADRHVFFKYMVKEIAEKHGFRATFMPKPFANVTGNGCHIHLSVWDLADQTNLFLDQAGELGLSSLAYQFMGGVLHSAIATCAFTNPTINSYKRLNAPVRLAGKSRPANTISYSGNNRTHAIRIPGAGRFEYRLGDGAAHPYLMPAALIAAGLDGITHQRDPGTRHENNNYIHPLPPGALPTMPTTLLDALRALQQDHMLKQAMGQDLITAYLKLKHEEWLDYSSQITAWEGEYSLDC